MTVIDTKPYIPLQAAYFEKIKMQKELAKQQKKIKK